MEISAIFFGSKEKTVSTDWGKKCDANGDGKLTDSELLLFEQGKDKANLGEYNKDSYVSIGGVAIFEDHIESVSYDSNSESRPYQVKFKNGLIATWAKQNTENNANLVLDETKPVMSAYNVKDGAGLDVVAPNGYNCIFGYNTNLTIVDKTKGQ